MMLPEADDDDAPQVSTAPPPAPPRTVPKDSPSSRSTTGPSKPIAAEVVRKEPEEYEEEEPRPKKKKKPAAEESSGFWNQASPLKIAGTIVLLVILVCVKVYIRQEARANREQNRAPQQVTPHIPQIAPAIPPPMSPPPIMPIGSSPAFPSDSAPAPVTAPLGAPATPAAMAGLTGDLPGETPLPAMTLEPFMLLRPRASDPIYQLSNLRSAPGLGMNVTVYKFDYRRIKASDQNRLPTVYFRSNGGQPQPIRSFPAFGMFGSGPPESDTMEIEVRSLGFGRMDAQPQNIEFYMAEYGWVPTIKSFKVSNSVILGTVNPQTRIRDWTVTEADLIRSGQDRTNPSAPTPRPAATAPKQPTTPPDGTMPETPGTKPTPPKNVPPTPSKNPDFAGLEVGEETKLTETTDLLGLDIQLNDAKDRIVQLKPVFSRQTPVPDGHQRLLGGVSSRLTSMMVTLNTKGQPQAITGVFTKIPNGQFYKSTPPQTVGNADAAKTKVALSSRGLKVIGILVRSDDDGVNGFQLVRGNP
jgi:hypothetical protein